MQPTQQSVLARLARANPTSVFLAMLVLVLVGLFAPGIVGGGLLLLLGAGLVFLMAKTWLVQTPATRAVRLLMLTLLITFAMVKIL